MRRIIAVFMVMIMVAMAVPATVGAQQGQPSGSQVPGHQGRDGTVNGHYTFTTVDANYGECTYVVNYRGDFGDDAYLDNGWIQNHITCEGDAGTNSFNYLFVHESDPRYTGNEDWAIWGTWEWRILTASGYGNVIPAQPQSHGGGN